MSEFNLSRHAELRLGQRNFRRADIEVVLECGTLIAADAYLMRKADADREVAALKHEIQRIERLTNVKVVVAEGTVVTSYRSRPDDQRRTLRRGRSSR